MHAILLVGGEGTRLRPLTYRTPKAMVPILGRPFLEHMLVYLRRYGVTTVSLALGHMPDPIQAYFGDGSRWGIDLRMVVEPEPLGSAGAIKQFEAELDEPFFACNGDILTTFDLDAMRELHRRSDAAVSITLMEVEDPSLFGVATLNREQRIDAFVEKPPRELAPSRWANAGIWLFEPWTLGRIPTGRRSMVETELFPELIAAGERVQGYCEQAFWVDIGTPARYLAAQLQLLAEPALRILPLDAWPGTSWLRADPSTGPAPVVAPGATVEGGVLLGEGVTIAPGARVVGPAALGAGSQVGTDAMVERSVLWDRCRLESGCTVRDSVLATGVRVGRGALLEDVVAGHRAMLSAATFFKGVRVRPAGL